MFDVGCWMLMTDDVLFSFTVVDSSTVAANNDAGQNERLSLDFFPLLLFSKIILQYSNVFLLTSQFQTKSINISRERRKYSIECNLQHIL